MDNLFVLKMGVMLNGYFLNSLSYLHHFFSGFTLTIYPINHKNQKNHSSDSICIFKWKATFSLFIHFEVHFEKNSLKFSEFKGICGSVLMLKFLNPNSFVTKKIRWFLGIGNFLILLPQIHFHQTYNGYVLWQVINPSGSLSSHGLDLLLHLVM